tara:strand:- start:566 stop:706 length:141 start_codon:yes stop_codon:yes gene_type:complete
MGKQNKELLKNIEEYDKKKKTKQSKSQILGQKQVKYTKNKRETVNS